MGLTDWASQELTPQNSYIASAPLNVQALSGNVNQAQVDLQNQVQPGQQALAQALLLQSQGAGPNPAEQMLQQNTNQNIQQSQGQIASQKGINPALAQRLATGNAANLNQQAAGQAGLMGAQQQLNAQTALGANLGQQATEDIQNTTAAGGAANTAGLGAQQINAGVAAQNAAANQNTSGGLLNGAAAAAAAFLNQGGRVGYDDGGGVGSMFDSGGSFNGSDASSQIANALLKSAGVNVMPSGNANQNNQGMASLGSAIGDTVKHMGQGSAASDPVYNQVLNNNPLGVSGVTPPPENPSLMGYGTIGPSSANMPDSAAQFTLPQTTFAKGGKVPAKLHHFANIYHPHMVQAMVSPGEEYLKPGQAKELAKGDTKVMAKGKKFQGQAKMAGDSPANDTIPASLEKGGFVIPRSIMESSNPADEAKKFVAERLMQDKRGNHKADFKDALKKAIGLRGQK